ncbi:MAG: response regulator [Elusimicrobia bacterium]|nr:response regulator [Elusimicrobiota bacterium]
MAPQSRPSSGRRPALPEPARLLIVEDDPLLPSSLEDVLEDVCDAKLARTIAAGRRLVKHWRPDIVLCDVLLPDGDGIAFCRGLKGSPETAQTIVVLLTALSNRETMLDGWKAGADDYIPKPFVGAELVARVRGLLDAAQARLRAQALDNLRTREQFQRDFVANISHELRTPIAAIRGFAETLRRSRDESVRRTFLSRIEHQTLRLERLVDDLLTLARLEASGGEGWDDDLSLSELLEDGVARARPAAARAKAGVEARVEAGLAVRGDRDHLRRALECILDNALRFEARKIVVAAGRKGRFAVVSVTDDGVGIPGAHLDRVFDHFFRPTLPAKHTDTGLGLSIVRRVVESHGGRLWADSDGERGATFSFSLPLLRR